MFDDLEEFFRYSMVMNDEDPFLEEEMDDDMDDDLDDVDDYDDEDEFQI